MAVSHGRRRHCSTRALHEATQPISPRNPDCVALGSRALFMDPDGLPLVEFIDCFDHADVERTLMRPAIGILHPTVAMSRRAVLAVGGYRADYPHVEDLDLFLRLGEIGRLANLPEVLLDYRNHFTNVSHSNAAEQSAAALARGCRRLCPPRDGRPGLRRHRHDLRVAPGSSSQVGVVGARRGSSPHRSQARHAGAEECTAERTKLASLGLRPQAVSDARRALFARRGHSSVIPTVS